MLLDLIIFIIVILFFVNKFYLLLIGFVLGIVTLLAYRWIKDHSYDQLAVKKVKQLVKSGYLRITSKSSDSNVTNIKDSRNNKDDAAS